MNDYKLQYLRLEICEDIKSPIRSKNGTNMLQPNISKAMNNEAIND